MANWSELCETAKTKASGLSEEYSKRLRVELKEIDKQGANDYWVQLFNNGHAHDCNNNGLVLPFLLGVTPIDPIDNDIDHKWQQHSDFPDIDLDLLPTSRVDVKKYVSDRYGEDYICGVGSWVTYKPKSALLDTFRAHGMDKGKVFEFTKDLPDEFDDLGLKTLLDYRKSNSKEVEKFTKFYDLYDYNESLVKKAYRLVGMIRSAGTHAGGVIISNQKLRDLIPMSMPKSEGSQFISQWTEGRNTQLSKFGIIKFDLLGLKTLHYIWKCCNMVKENRGKTIDWMDMDPDEKRLGVIINDDDTRELIMMDDKKSMKMINQLKTESVFQHETAIQKRIINDGKVKSFWDMVIYSVLGRPGPMEMIPTYYKNRDDKNKRWREGQNPEIIKILDETHGVICYQENLTSMWIKFGGFTIPQAEEARKVVSKKWADKMPMVKKKWLDGATKSLGEEAAINWWNKMDSFSRYAFNRAHGLAYGLISFRCLFLKAHFGPEWWASVMSMCHQDKLPRYMNVAKGEGVEFETLDANNLSDDYSVSNKKISLGITSIKGIGKSAVEQFCKKEEYKSIYEFIDKCGKQKTVMERLVKLGAFDKFYNNRRALWQWYLYKYGPSTKEIKDLRQEISDPFTPSEQEIEVERKRQAAEYFKMYPKRKKIPKKIQNWKPKVGHRYDVPTFQQIADIYKDDFKLSEKLLFEKEYLGYYWSNPMDQFKHNEYVIAKAKKAKVSRVEGVIEAIEGRKLKSGDDYLVLHITDGEQMARINIWPNALEGIDDNLLGDGVGIRADVEYKKKFDVFNLKGILMPLEKLN